MKKGLLSKKKLACDGLRGSSPIQIAKDAKIGQFTVSKHALESWTTVCGSD